MAYWNEIQRSTSARATTAQVWDAIKTAQAAEPGGGGAVTLRGVNEVRAAAAALRNSGDQFAKARALEERTGLPQAITGAMMSTAPWSRPPAALAAMPEYHVRFLGSFLAPDGQQLQQYLTVKYGANTLPGTTGDLVDALTVGVPNKSIPAGYSLVNVDDLTITVV